MIVTLGHYQSRVVMSRIPELHATAMAEHREPHGAKMHTYDLPAVAWKQIRDHLYLNPLYYGPLGGKLDSQPHSLYRAIQLIHRAVLEIEHHPALAGVAVTGHQARIIPCFANEVDYSPYPPGVFLVLAPLITTHHGQEFTYWQNVHGVPGDSYGHIISDETSWTFHEEAHLGFLNTKV